MSGYQTLKVWHVANLVTKTIYEITETFPKSEMYNFTDQMRRAALSIPSNIAEGSRRIHKNEKRQSYSIAYGSAGELDTQLKLAKTIGLITDTTYERIQDPMDHLLRLLNLLLRKFR